MKKTISANLGGMVFHMDEDAYLLLNKYLESLRRHYAGMEGGSEILSDIEFRLAELFSNSLAGRQVIGLNDVEQIMHQVGTVEAIAAEAGEEGTATSADQPQVSEMAGDADNPVQEKRLYRDLDQAIIGGVCSGIAAWFNVNPLWVRLGFAGIFFGFIPFLPMLAGPVFLAYIALWIAVPGRKNLENHGNFRRFFLNGRYKVLGGVCSGIGRYFNIDPTLVRVLFILGLFLGGGGVLIYIVLWIITPEASSLSDEIRMEGQQINLQTLEAQVKKRLEPDNSKPESALTKVLLFPFRLLATVLEGLKPLLQLAVDLVRIFTGLLLMFIGGVLLFAFVVTVLSLFGYTADSSDFIHFGNFPVNRIMDELSPWLIGAAGLTALIPSFLIMMLGIGLMVKRKVLNRYMITGLGVLFFASAAFTAVLVIPKIKAFQKEGMVVKTMEFTPAGNLLSLQMNQSEEGEKEEDIFQRSLRIVAYDGKTLLLRQRFRARGGTSAEAKANARAASLEVFQLDSSLIFNEELKVDPAVPFRAQSVEMILYIPRGMRFKMDSGLYSMLDNAESEDNPASSESNPDEDSLKLYTGNNYFKDVKDYDEETIWTLRGAVLVPADTTKNPAD